MHLSIDHLEKSIISNFSGAISDVAAAREHRRVPRLLPQGEHVLGEWGLVVVAAVVVLICS